MPPAELKLSTSANFSLLLFSSEKVQESKSEVPNQLPRWLGSKAASFVRGQREGHGKKGAFETTFTTHV